MSETAAPHGTFSQHYRWPQPWEGIGLPWYEDAKEHRPPDVLSNEAQAARLDLIETLATQPSVYWLRADAEYQLSWKFNISTTTARRLLRDCPDSVMLPGGIWCAVSVAAGWSGFKRRVYQALKADALLTFDEVKAAADADHAAVCIQDTAAEEPRFCRSRPGGRWASYADLAGSAPAAKLILITHLPQLPPVWDKLR